MKLDLSIKLSDGLGLLFMDAVVNSGNGTGRDKKISREHSGW